MGISINIAIQLARIAPLLKDCKSGVMLGRQAMHFRPPDWKPRLIASLETLGINTTEEEIFQDDGFCEAYLSKIGWPKMESLDFSDIEGAEYIHDLSYVYVPAAFTWLQYHFPGRTKFIRGNSLVEVPKLSLERPDLRFGMYHLDGSKFTHLQEVVSAYHILEDNALIVHDDSNLGPVKRGDRKLRLIGLTREFEQENIGLRLTDHHRIRQKQAGATWV